MKKQTIQQNTTVYKPGSKLLYNDIIVTITSVVISPVGYYYNCEWLNEGMPCSCSLYECQINSPIVNKDALMTIGFKD